MHFRGSFSPSIWSQNDEQASSLQLGTAVMVPDKLRGTRGMTHSRHVLWKILIFYRLPRRRVLGAALLATVSSFNQGDISVGPFVLCEDIPLLTTL